MTIAEQGIPPTGFPTTHWSLVGRAGCANDAERRDALSELLHQYLPPMRAHLRFSKRLNADEAEDVLQAFIADKVLEQNLLARADSARGKFRSFLLASLDRYSSNLRRADAALKRRPAHLASLDEGAVAFVDPPDRAGDHFDVAWARQTLAQVVEQMRAECHASGQSAIWGVFEARTLNPILNDAAPVPYPALVERYGLESPAQASNALVTANRTFARLLRQAIGRYEFDPQAIEEEIRELRRVLSSPGARSA